MLTNLKYFVKGYKLALLLITISVSSLAQKVHFDDQKWVEYVEGNIPLVISVPHGGRITVDTLPFRDCKEASTVSDARTIELARAIQDYFNEKYNLTPHIIISHISRKHVDQNRELENGATCGHKSNEKPWHTFHNWVDSALNLATANGNRAMYIDLHGHGHKNQRLEVGYNLTTTDLQAILDNTFDSSTKYHSITNLLNLENSLNFKDMIFGENAFGTLLANRALPATPSKQDLVPAQGEAFFSGGDNTRRFTGKDYPNVFGLQIECNRDSRSDAQRKDTAKAISDAAVEYLNRYAKTNIQPVK